MAWFDKDDLLGDGDQEFAAGTAPLTIERLEQLFTAKQWSYEVTKDDDGTPCIQSAFNGHIFIFSITQNSFYHVFAYGNGMLLPADRLGDIMAWANTWNLNTIFGTACVFPQSDDSCAVRIDQAFPLASSLDDEQLEAVTNCAISCALQALEKYAEDFQLETPENSGKTA